MRDPVTFPSRRRVSGRASSTWLSAVRVDEAPFRPSGGWQTTAVLRNARGTGV
jgi:hypothetical protein